MERISSFGAGTVPGNSFYNTQEMNGANDNRDEWVWSIIVGLTAFDNILLIILKEFSSDSIVLIVISTRSSWQNFWCFHLAQYRSITTVALNCYIIIIYATHATHETYNAEEIPKNVKMGFGIRPIGYIEDSKAIGQ